MLQNIKMMTSDIVRNLSESGRLFLLWLFFIQFLETGLVTNFESVQLKCTYAYSIYFLYTVQVHT